MPSTLDKHLYNIGPDLSKLLDAPSVDTPVAALSSPTVVAGGSEEVLKPEKKRSEQTLVKGFQAGAWAVRAATATSFFTRASLVWIQQLQERLDTRDTRSHRDLNKIKAAMEYAADASLNAARFASRAMASSVTSRRLLWLKPWQADIRTKWRLVTSPYRGGQLFGTPLDPYMTESKDKRKVLSSIYLYLQAS